ncbi:MAG TPA: Mur ligase family protein, partial [Planctomycetota bacterium]|nr:Mur ligase family protein [Planctomycetota bacterium]
MKIFAITGSKGKSTVAWMLRAGLRACGAKVAMLSTIERDLCGDVTPAHANLPGREGVDDFSLRASDVGADALILEATAWGLKQGWLDGLLVDVAILTNLRDGYHVPSGHPDRADYEASKRRLFERLRPGALAIINLDEPGSSSFAKAAMTAGAAVRGYGEGPGRAWRWELLEALPGAGRWIVKGRKESAEVVTPAGHHQGANAAAAVAALVESGYPAGAVA